jgi:NFU1 iron-sulfur cluster scaffold homolog, mitochondrial
MLRRTFARLLFGLPIAGRETPNPDCLQFRTEDDEFMPGDYTVDVPTRKHAQAHPLAQMLFDQYDREVRSVFLSRNYVTVTKWSDLSWHSGLERSIGGLIAQYLMYNEPMAPSLEAGFRDVDSDIRIAEGDSEAVQCVKELLKTEIKPMVQRDGGDVRLVSFDEGTGLVSLEMLGACKTCPSSRNTLKDGIERMLKHFVEEVTEVIEVKRYETEEKALARERASAEVEASIADSTGQVGGGRQGNYAFVPTPDTAKSTEEREAAVRYEEFVDGAKRDDDRIAALERKKGLRKRLARKHFSLEELMEPDA